MRFAYFGTLNLLHCEQYRLFVLVGLLTENFTTWKTLTAKDKHYIYIQLYVIEYVCIIYYS